MSKKRNKITGNAGENLACEYLENNDYQILTRNYNTSFGEIDIIALDAKEIVFIEVKTRTQYMYGMPKEAVNIFKKNHIYNSAKYYLYKNNLLNSSIRFDVIEIYLSKGVNHKITHIKNAITDSPYIQN